jgi:hypothetical protein
LSSQSSSREALRQLKSELAEARKLHRIDESDDAERRLEQLLRLIRRETTR